jgi:hypothetical protein
MSDHSPSRRSPPVVDYEEDGEQRRSPSRSPIRSPPRFSSSYKRAAPKFAANTPTTSTSMSYKRERSPPPRERDERPRSRSKIVPPTHPHRDYPDSHALQCPCGHGHFMDVISTTVSNNCISIKYQCANRKGGCNTIRDLVIRQDKGQMVLTM